MRSSILKDIELYNFIQLNLSLIFCSESLFLWPCRWAKKKYLSVVRLKCSLYDELILKV